MSAYLDIIILLLVVVMVFAKLKSLLGTRPENETEISRESAAKIFDILMQEHNRKHGAQPTPAELRTDDENLSESEKALQKIPGFNRDKFLNSAKKAFEIIVTSFAKGDVKTLETLVSKNLLKKFKEIIGKRQEEGISAETDFIGFDEAVIADAIWSKSASNLFPNRSTSCAEKTAKSLKETKISFSPLPTYGLSNAACTPPRPPGFCLQPRNNRR